MVGSCPHCKRPWYSAGETAPDACRGCGQHLSCEATAEPAPATPPAGKTAEAIVQEVTARQARIESVQEFGTVSRTMMIIGGVGLLIAAVWAVETWNFKRNAVRMTGRVESTSAFRYRGQRGTITTVEYYAGNGRQTLTVWNPESESVPLLVSKTNPADARTPDGMWTNKVGIGAIAGVVFVGGLFLRPGRREIEAALA